jgi:hypothetical protein
MEKLSVRDFIYFDKMIMPSVITIIYWVVCVLAVLSILVTGISLMAAGSALRGLLTIILGCPLSLLAVRLYCELLVVVFKIHGNLQKIADKE